MKKIKMVKLGKGSYLHHIGQEAEVTEIERILDFLKKAQNREEAEKWHDALQRAVVTLKIPEDAFQKR